MMMLMQAAVAAEPRPTLTDASGWAEGEFNLDVSDDDKEEAYNLDDSITDIPEKTTKIMKKFENLIPQYATCIRNGERVILMTEELTLGDIIEVQWGDIIPADIRILRAKGFKVDNSPLTGESNPLTR